ncbi:hypothetical protein [Pantoea vagans]|nr:hypothetical protein [Pantoea vagans]MDE8554994.1 hypothetical protein [Pantoea vagans]MDE8575044.1 hypothetical protein [Pantoea vagans]
MLMVPDWPEMAILAAEQIEALSTFWLLTRCLPVIQIVLARYRLQPAR